MLKVEVTKVRAHLKYDIVRTGSVLAGTITASIPKMESTYEIESSASVEQVSRLIRAARNGCFVRAALTSNVIMEDVTKLNGQDIDVWEGAQ